MLDRSSLVWFFVTLFSVFLLVIGSILIGVYWWQPSYYIAFTLTLLGLIAIPWYFSGVIEKSREKFEGQRILFDYVLKWVAVAGALTAGVFYIHQYVLQNKKYAYQAYLEEITDEKGEALIVDSLLISLSGVQIGKIVPEYYKSSSVLIPMNQVDEVIVITAFYDQGKDSEFRVESDATYKTIRIVGKINREGFTTVD